MSGERARQRNLKNQIGDTAAAAVVEAQQRVQQLALEHRVLAAQMLEFEKTVATVRAGRAVDRGMLESHGAHITELLAWHAESRDRLDRQVDNLRIEHARTMQFESMGFWRRLRWFLAGARPPFYDPVNDKLVDRSTQTAYPGDGV